MIERMTERINSVTSIVISLESWFFVYSDFQSILFNFIDFRKLIMNGKTDGPMDWNTDEQWMDWCSDGPMDGQTDMQNLL